jgi:RNA polymerase-binding transcription factor DksA
MAAATMTRGADGADMAALRRAFVARLAELEAGIAALEAEKRQPLAADFAEQSGAVEAIEEAEGLELARRREIAELGRAVASIDAGSYGVCASCGRPIPAKRLAVQPSATRCVGCA